MQYDKNITLINQLVYFIFHEPGCRRHQGSSRGRNYVCVFDCQSIDVMDIERVFNILDTVDVTLANWNTLIELMFVADETIEDAEVEKLFDREDDHDEESLAK